MTEVTRPIDQMRAIFRRHYAKVPNPYGRRCGGCHRPMAGTTAYDGACACGGLIEATRVRERTPARERKEKGKVVHLVLDHK